MILINSSSKNALRIFQPFLPISIPVGIGCLLAVAEREGIEAYCVDEQIEDDALGLIQEYAKRLTRPYIFGFSVLTAAFEAAVNLSQRLKALYPDSVIVFGGVHPTAAPEEVLAFDHIDLVLRNEGERALPKLYRLIKNGREFTHLENLSYRQNGRIVHNPQGPSITDLDALPSFPYHLFEPRRDRYDLGFILSSRGCPYHCVFCSNRITTGRRYRFKSNESVIADLDLLHGAYGLKHVLFLDDNFLVSRPRIQALLEEIRRRDYHRTMSFSFQARGDNVDHEILSEMYVSGFKSVFFGLETASEEIMKVIDKGETVAQCAEAVRLAKEIGFHVSGTFIFALPGETHQDRMKAAQMSKALGLDMVRFNNATPYPGTRLHEMAKRADRLCIQGHYKNFNSISTFIEDPRNKIPFSYVPAGNTEEEIRTDILLSYLAFYLDPVKLSKIINRPDQGVGWFSAGESLFEKLSKVPALLVLGVMLGLKLGGALANVLLHRNTSASALELIRLIRVRPDNAGKLTIKHHDRSPPAG